MGMKIKHLFFGVALIATFCGCAKHGGSDPRGIFMSYRLDNAYMDYKYFQVDIAGTGECKIIYRALDDNPQAKAPPTEKVLNVTVPGIVIDRMADLYKELDFFNFQPQDLNKDTITVKDVGTTTLSYKISGKNRKLVYGYIKDKTLAKLTGMFWNIAAQTIRRSERLK